MTFLQILAALLAFGACSIAFASFIRIDPMRRSSKRALVRAGDLSEVMHDVESPRLGHWLHASGFSGTDAVLIFHGCTIGMALIGGIVATIGAAWVGLGSFGVILMAAAGVFIGSRIVPSIVDAQWGKRARRIRDGFPLMLDMLDVCTTAGLSVDVAWQAVERQIMGVNRELSDEMAMVALEVRLGVPREEALRNMAERTGVGDAAALASMLVQSEHFGSGLADTFRSQATSMREETTRLLEERAHSSSVKAVLPVAVLLLPAFLMVTLVPMLVLLVNVIEEIK